jgi:hypothetical protein
MEKTMAKVGDRVKETSATTGTGTLDLAGAPTGFRGFGDEFTSGDSVYYLLVDDPDNPTEYEYGTGTFTSGTPDTLSRDSVEGSSNGGAKVSWIAGCTVISTPTAALINSLLTSASIGATVQAHDDDLDDIAATAHSAGRVLMSDGTAWSIYDHLMGRNKLINPEGAIYQDAVAATADDTYFADQWYALTQTGSVTPSVLTDPEDGFPFGVRLTQSQASAQRFGYAQIIEGKGCKGLRGGDGVFVARIRVSASQAVRYAILGWTGTEDSVTSDVVNDWTSATYTAGNFFLAANVSVLAVGAQTPVANAWTSLDALSGALGSSFNNLILMVWTEGTAAQNFTLDFDFNQFEAGSIPTAFERRPFALEVTLCERHCEKSYGLGVAPGTVTSAGAKLFNPSTANFVEPITYRVRKRADATITFYSPATGASGNIRSNTSAADFAVSSGNEGQIGVAITAGGGTAGNQYSAHWVAKARL